MKLDPKSARSDSAFTPVPAGQYLLGITSFKRATGRESGQDYLRIRFEVAVGAKKGKSFYTNLSLNLNSKGALQRWALLCEVLGITEEFELGSTKEGTEREGDANFARLFVGRAFKAVVAVTQSGEHISNEISQIVYPRLYTDADWREAKVWEESYKSRTDNFDLPDEEAAPARKASNDSIDSLLDDYDDEVSF